MILIARETETLSNNVVDIDFSGAKNSDSMYKRMEFRGGCATLRETWVCFLKKVYVYIYICEILLLGLINNPGTSLILSGNYCLKLKRVRIQNAQSFRAFNFTRGDTRHLYNNFSLPAVVIARNRYSTQLIKREISITSRMEIVWNPLDAATTLFDINWITDFSPRFFFISPFFFFLPH